VESSLVKEKTMEPIADLIGFFLNIDDYLSAVTQAYGGFTYLILFLIVFLETGIVITPFLPGDSLLFAAGTLAANGSLDAVLLVAALSAAAVAGDTVNYWIGHNLGPRVFKRFLKKEHLDSAHLFYEKHGSKTIVIARFVPIIRTFAPFVAGIAKMNYLRFLVYNIAGGTAWVCIFVFGGYYFGSQPIVKQNFTLAILAIVFLSIMPATIELLRNRRQW